MDDLTDIINYSHRFLHRTTGITADVPDAGELDIQAKRALSIIYK